MMDYSKKLQDLEGQISEMRKMLTMQEGTETGKDESSQDGNMGMGSAVSGNVDYEKQSFNEDSERKKQMMLAKMKGY